MEVNVVLGREATGVGVSHNAGFVWLSCLVRFRWYPVRSGTNNFGWSTHPVFTL